MPDKTILVVGANRGIGLNLVKTFAKKGWHVVGSVRSETKNDSSVQELRDTGADVLEMDFTDEYSIINAAKSFRPAKLDVMINCGGVTPEPRNWVDHTEAVMLEKLRVMVIGPFLASKHFLPHLKNADSACIVNVSSDAGCISRARGYYIGYSMAKAALNCQTATMAKELELEGEKISVISVNPGYVATRLTDWDFEDDMDTCIAGLAKIIEAADMSKTGRFFNWDGTERPW